MFRRSRLLLLNGNSRESSLRVAASTWNEGSRGKKAPSAHADQANAANWVIALANCAAMLQTSSA
jgi:hypothetical protein